MKREQYNTDIETRSENTSIKKELNNTVKNYSKVIDMIESTYIEHNTVLNIKSESWIMRLRRLFTK